MMQAKNYRALCTAFYDAEKPHPPQEELSFYCDLLRATGGKIVEPMCGSGRFMLPFLRDRLDIVGFDNSPAMIGRCRARLQDESFSPDRAVLADFDSFQSAAKFDQSVIPAGSFGLLDEQPALRALQMHTQWLSKEGLLHVEVFVATEKKPPQLARSARVAEIDVRRCIGLVVEAHMSDIVTVQHVTCHYTDVCDGKIVETETEHYAIRHYELNAFQALAMSCGLRVVSVRERVFADARALVTLKRHV